MAEKKTTNLHSLSEIGEFELIKHLTKNIAIKQKSTIHGVGDDCAVLNYGKNLTLITTDMLTEGIHFNLMYSPLKHLGYKSVVVNLSDIYAMNGTPRQIVISLGLSGKFSQEALDIFYEGVYLACEKYGVDLVGGDTTSSLTGLTISITAIGDVDTKKIAYRKGAQKNDIICTTGNLGAAYMGLQILERERVIFEKDNKIQPDLSGFEYIIERQLKPEARKDIVELLDSLDIVPTSMIDVSDGLSSELFHICEQSSTGCKIFENKIPIDLETAKAAEEFNMLPITAALNGGEDYELLFTISAKDYEKIEGKTGISMIGHITEDTSIKRLILNNDNEADLQAQGWKSF